MNIGEPPVSARSTFHAEAEGRTRENAISSRLPGRRTNLDAWPHR